jgi:hypothetical protein
VKRSLKVARTGVAVALLAWGGLASVHAVSQSRAAVTPTTVMVNNSPATRVSAFYLDIGASSSLGVQAIPGRSEGYSNDLVSLEAARGVALGLKEVGCPGETSASILLRGPQSHVQLMESRCYHHGPGQLAQSTSYLKSHRGELGLVTIDSGFNDVRTCLNTATVNQACFDTNLAIVKLDLPILLSDLRSAAGPLVHFVGLEYSDPFLQHYLSGPQGATQATLSLQDMDSLNAVLASDYAHAGMAVANVPAFYDSADSTLTTLAPYGSIPTDVKQICLMTWMCTSAHDDHANKLGYEVEADAILKVLPKVFH